VAAGRTRDVAVVLSGGGISGILLELGFLQRLRETPAWGRIGWIYGTSAGALSGAMAALDRVGELETLVLGLQPGDVFRPRRLWQLPGGLHDYSLPETIAERLAPPATLAEELARSEVELVVFATDVSEGSHEDESRHYELSYSSRSTPPETMGRALLASAAVSALVLPIAVDGAVATDGSWVRNFPLEHAYRNPDAQAIAAFRYVASHPPSDVTVLARMRERLDRFRAVPPVRALLAEIRLAEERAGRGEPAHYAELIVRLMRVAVAQNSVLEERLAAERDLSVSELRRLRKEVVAAAVEAAPRRRRGALRARLETLFASAEFPFGHERRIPMLVVRGGPGDDALDASFRADERWPDERKRALVEHGYRLADEAIAAAGPELAEYLRDVAGSRPGRRSDLAPI
jgi:predicted acylesterase/phospholipase RssA